MGRLYANENFPIPVVEELRRLGHDVITTHEVGRSGSAVPDTEVIGFAISEGRAVVTINRRDFVRLAPIMLASSFAVKTWTLRDRGVGFIRRLSPQT